MSEPENKEDRLAYSVAMIIVFLSFSTFVFFLQYGFFNWAYPALFSYHIGNVPFYIPFFGANASLLVRMWMKNAGIYDAMDKKNDKNK